MAYRDSRMGMVKGRERETGERARRAALGICTRCGKCPAMPGRKSCGPCLEKRRKADREKYAAGKAAGLPYGGADPEVRKRAARARTRRRRKARLEAGLCVRCGARPPVEGRVSCQPCREKRHAAERRKYAERSAAGLCTRCGGPVHDGRSRCAVCAAIERVARDPERKNEISRRRYRLRRSADRCTDCGAPSQGASRCPECAKRSYERSDHFRGWPVYPPSFTVVLLETDEPVATFDDEMDVAAYLAFEKLDRDKVEVIVDRSPIQSIAGWE